VAVFSGLEFEGRVELECFIELLAALTSAMRDAVAEGSVFDGVELACS
jgi:hypothetical protein